MDANILKTIIVFLLLITTLKVRVGPITALLTIAYVFLFTDNFLWLLNMLVGLIISPILFCLTFLISYFRLLPQIKPDFSVIISKPEIALYSFNEEIVWRDFIYMFLLKNCTPALRIAIMLATTSGFVLMHESSWEKHQFIEKFFFSLILMLSCANFFGVHYGLHIGRNYMLFYYQEKGVSI